MTLNTSLLSARHNELWEDAGSGLRGAQVGKLCAGLCFSVGTW